MGQRPRIYTASRSTHQNRQPQSTYHSPQKQPSTTTTTAQSECRTLTTQTIIIDQFKPDFFEIQRKPNHEGPADPLG